MRKGRGGEKRDRNKEVESKIPFLGCPVDRELQLILSV